MKQLTLKKMCVLFNAVLLVNIVHAQCPNPVVCSSGMNGDIVSIKLGGVGGVKTTATFGYDNGIKLNALGATPNLIFQSRSSTLMTIKSNGKVGIGTTNPGEKLEVKGNLKISGTGYFGGNVSIPNSKLSVGGTPAINGFAISGTGYGSGYQGGIYAYGEFYDFYAGNSYAKNYFAGKVDIGKELQVSGSLRISGNSNFSGNVLIGSKLEVKDDINVTAGPDNDADLILTDASGNFGWIAQDDATSAMWIEHAAGQKLMLSGQYGADGVVIVKGNLGIGTTNPSSKLTVDGKIECEEIEVKDIAADYVFNKNYNLLSISEVESFIKEKGHLPGIPSAEETKEGVELGKFNSMLLQKIEELTLYMIELKKENEALKNSINNLKGN